MAINQENVKVVSIWTVVVSLMCLFLAFTQPALSAENIKDTQFFGIHYDPAITQMKAIPCDEKAEESPQPLAAASRIAYIQPWDGYCPPATVKDKKKAECLTCQTFNIKGSGLYDGIEVEGDKWMEMACDEATRDVKNGGGPFGAVIVQIDDETGKVIRYWRNHAHVVEWCDPTAHAELTTIRAACSELGVINLGKIEKDNPHLKLPQIGKTSHCVLYASTEPCPMCYTAIRRAGIKTLFFACTRFDAGVEGVGLPIDGDYAALEGSYNERASKYGLHIYQATVPNSLDAMNLYKRSEVVKY